MEEIIAIIGVGYIGLQNAITISKTGAQVLAFDIDDQRILELSDTVDINQDANTISHPNLIFTSDPTRLTEASYYLISIPTPINMHKVPNIFPLKNTAELIARTIKKGDVLILESTVFPGATRELLIPILEHHSKLKSGIDFFVGYSSELIVPNNSTDTQTLTKVISGQNTEALAKIKNLYERLFNYKLYCAPNLETAEASKLLEHVQRDVNIALMNEFTQIMEKMNLSIHEVIEASKTIANFIPFMPGLVGGHCIPEDPYYLMYQANKIGALPNLINTARQTNEQFFHFIVEMIIKLLTEQDLPLKNAKVAILGMSFKANVTDMRNSLSISLYHALQSLKIHSVACDPLVKQDGEDLNWVNLETLTECHAIILCQAHNEFKNISALSFSDKIIEHGVFIDIPGLFTHQPLSFRSDIAYWNL